MNVEHSAKPNNRIHGYDVIRGFSVISMIGFHLCYDLVYLYGVNLSWFRPPLQDVWRASISWTFILIAGIMATYSRSNFKRGCRYLVVAAVIFLVTTVAAVDTPISFGIIYCMGASTLVAEAIRRLMPKELSDRKSMALFAALLGAFLLCLDIPSGTFGLKALGGPYLRMPSAPYESGLLSWLGFPGPTFASGDYYTPLPFTLLYLAGTMLAKPVRDSTKVSHALANLRCRPLEFVGRHALEFYVLHQPLVLAALMAVFGR